MRHFVHTHDEQARLANFVKVPLPHRRHEPKTTASKDMHKGRSCLAGGSRHLFTFCSPLCKSRPANPQEVLQRSFLLLLLLLPLQEHDDDVDDADDADDADADDDDDHLRVAFFLPGRQCHMLAQGRPCHMLSQGGRVTCYPGTRAK